MKPHNQQSFTKSATPAEKGRRLMEVVGSDDTLGILINADPDAMASAIALKRIFWRKAKKILIYHINPLQRADNLAFIKFLRIDQQHLRHLKPALISRWALVDSQPQHFSEFRDIPFDIVIFRNADLRGNAGKTAQKLFERWGASAGGHKNAARAEMPLASLARDPKGALDPGLFVLRIIKGLK